MFLTFTRCCRNSFDQLKQKRWEFSVLISSFNLCKWNSSVTCGIGSVAPSIFQVNNVINLIYESLICLGDSFCRQSMTTPLKLYCLYTSPIVLRVFGFNMCLINCSTTHDCQQVCLHHKNNHVGNVSSLRTSWYCTCVRLPEMGTCHTHLASWWQ